ncbi:MAG: hypothetical protein AAGA30_05250 [Planctomycetota bacterium]
MTEPYEFNPVAPILAKAQLYNPLGVFMNKRHTIIALTFIACFWTSSYGRAIAQSQSYDEVARAVYSNTYTAKGRGPQDDVVENREPRKDLAHPPKYGVINYDIYRDRRPFPVDPRKPCHICIQRKGTHPKFKNAADRVYGFQGRPYQEREPGGCLCVKKKQNITRPNINVYWPSWFAGVREELAPVKSAVDAATFSRFHITDVFDHLSGFEISRYKRSDSGHKGPCRERYGCLGESKIIQSNVAGVGFRPPGQPAPRGGVEFPQ